MPTWNTTWTTFPQPNVTGFYQMMEYANSVTQDLFGVGLLMSTFVMLFIIFKRWGDDVAFSTASFMSMVLAGILRATGQVGDMYFLIFGLLTAVSVIVMWRR